MSRTQLLYPKIRAGIVAALWRFPWMLLCGLAGTIAGIVAGHSTGNQPMADQCLRVTMAAALGMPLFFSLRMLRERCASLVRWPVEIAGLPMLAVAYLLLPARPFEGPEIVPIRWALLLAALHFFAAVSPFVSDRGKNGFWQFNRHLFLRFCLTTLYTGVLTGGLELAMFSAEKLFNGNLEHSYWNLFCLMAGCFHPAFFLAGVPRDFTALDADTEHPRGLKAFAQFALAPLVVVYTAILYAYAGKIVLEHAWPHGWVALPVLVLSGIGILAALLLHPLRARSEENWARCYSRYFPLALAPLSVLLLLSVWTRIATYGVTEERYLGLVTGSWILVWALVFLFRKDAGLRWVPASLAAICLAAAFGPWSAGAVSQASQLRRLEARLAARGAWVNGHVQIPATGQKLAEDEYADLQSTMRYLIRMHGGESLRGLFATLFQDMDWKKLDAWQFGRDTLEKLKLVDSGASESLPGNGAVTPPTSASYLYQFDENTSASLEGFRQAWYVGYVGNPHTFADIKLDFSDGVLTAAVGNETVAQPVPMDAFLHSLPGTGATLPADKLTVDWTQNGRSLRIVFTTLRVHIESDRKLRIGYTNFLLLEK